MNFRASITREPLTPAEEEALYRSLYQTDSEDFEEKRTFPGKSGGLSRYLKEAYPSPPRNRERFKISNEFASLKRDIGHYLLIEDRDVLSVVFGAAAAHRFGTLPVWLMLVGAPSSAKTAFLDLLADVEGIYPLSDLTAQTLASGYHPEPAKVKKGNTSADTPPQNFSLLEQFTDKTILLLKDFTSVLQMHHDKQSAILAQLREIYDGEYNKSFGNGKAVNWRGRIGLLAGVTPVIDRHTKVMGTMGPRFLLFRPAQPAPEAQAMQALTNNYGEQAITKAGLAQQVAQFLEALTDRKPEFTDRKLLNDLVAVAHLVTMARSPVERSWDNREMDYVPEPEMPARFAQQLQSLALGIALVHGHAAVEEDDIRIVTRVALDAIPQSRRLALDALATLKKGRGTITEVAGLIPKQSLTTTRRAFEDLTVLGVMTGPAANGVATIYSLKQPDWGEILLRAARQRR